jgi:hypothetical protein
LEHYFSYIGLIAGVLGLRGIAGTATHIAWIFVRCLSDFCGQSRYGPPTARLRHEAECWLFVTITPANDQAAFLWKKA